MTNPVDKSDERRAGEGGANGIDTFLADAVSAARGQADEGVHDGAHTRLRLRESLASRGVQRRKRFTVIAAVIASLFGSTAFAYWAGWRPPWSQPAVVDEAPDADAHDGVSVRLPESRRGSAKSTSPDGVQTIVTMEAPPELGAIPDAGHIAEVGSVPAPPPAPVDPAPPELAPSPSNIANEPMKTATNPTKTVTTTAKKRPVETKLVETKPETKPVETKPVESKPVETKLVETKPLETKPVETKLVETKPVETNPVESKPVESKLTTAPTTDTPKAQPSGELVAYRRAHELHFRGSDPKAALRAWDDYLAKYPNGALAPEARYDRALVLVKLARWAEARAALAPFANAKVGSYRQNEAAKILAAIRDR
ncbi:MAG: tetratricopeptide repeat protein [Kofleriaceae bacterium]